MKKDDILKMKRSQVRYHLYRVRTYVEDGTKYEREDIKKFFERQKGFTSWQEFARIWDVDEEGRHDKIIRRSETENEEWNKILEKEARELSFGSQSEF